MKRFVLIADFQQTKIISIAQTAEREWTVTVMSEYISKEKVIATIKRMYERCGGDINDYRDLMIECINVMPCTIDLVRCDECKESRESVYFEEHPTCVFKAYPTLCCRMLKIAVDPDFYCGHGERRG